MQLLFRALSLLRLMGTFRAARDEAAAALREASRKLAFVAVAALTGVLALVFLLIAIYLALATVWPAHWAAFAVAFLMAAATLLMLLAANGRPYRPRRMRLQQEPLASRAAPSPAQAGLAGDAALDDDPAEAVHRTMQTTARKHPLALLAGALAVGLMVGLSGRNHKR